MSHKIVKISSFRDFVDNPPEIDGLWHFVDWIDDPKTLCGGIAFEEESVFKIKEVERGGINCKLCLSKINKYQSIKL